MSLVIPAKNEARNLPRVLTDIPKVVGEVILVDGLSTDVTHMVATEHRPDIRIVHERKPGKGNALRAGFAAATGDIIVAMDADGSMMSEEIPRLLYFLTHGYDFVKGSRFISGGSSLDITPVRKLGNSMLCSLANAFFETQFTDLCYGFFAFHRKFLPHLALTSQGFEIETEITVRAAKIGLRMAETPSIEMPRFSGSSNLNAFRDGIRVLRALFHERRPAFADRGPTLPETDGPVGQHA
ncbi:MAG TPA: glycosyltransferase family 2 protein [Acidimicrobiales bacterium]|nr:glycosyltransferase family 2 protein [Acidimicrobiales bacterium]